MGKSRGPRPETVRKYNIVLSAIKHELNANPSQNPFQIVKQLGGDGNTIKYARELGWVERVGDVWKWTGPDQIQPTHVTSFFAHRNEYLDRTKSKKWGAIAKERREVAFVPKKIAYFEGEIFGVKVRMKPVYETKG